MMALAGPVVQLVTAMPLECWFVQSAPGTGWLFRAMCMREAGKAAAAARREAAMLLLIALLMMMKACCCLLMQQCEARPGLG